MNEHEIAANYKTQLENELPSSSLLNANTGMREKTSVVTEIMQARYWCRRVIAVRFGKIVEEVKVRLPLGHSGSARSRSPVQFFFLG